MTESAKPFVQFEAAGVASFLSYNVPSPVTHFGTHILELDIPGTFFKEAPQELKPRPELTLAQVRQAMLDGFTDTSLFPNVGTKLTYLEGSQTTYVSLYAQEVGVSSAVVPEAVPIYRSQFTREGTTTTTFTIGSSFDIPIGGSLFNLTPALVLAELQKGNLLRVRFNNVTSLWEAVFLTLADVRPRLAVIERYRLTSFLGDYGAGRVVSTFSLLPGESTKITVSTYTRTSSKRNETSTILDSVSEEAAQNFEDAVQSETTNREESQRRDSWSIEASASGSFGVASAKFSAGYSGSASSGREQLAKNVTNALSKSANRASNKRDIQVKQTSTTSVEEGREDSIEREIHNINAGRTLNFVFRQMNQEFFTLMHLVDAQVAFIDFARSDSLRVVDLPDLDTLLNEVLAGNSSDPHHAEVREIIRTVLDNVFDHQDRPHSVIEERKYEGGDVNFFRFRSELIANFQDRFFVPGVILAVQRNVLRTDGLIVEALLGQSDGLDAYAKGLQEQQVRAKRIANETIALEADRNTLALEILRKGDRESARIYADIFARSSLITREIPITTPTAPAAPAQPAPAAPAAPAQPAPATPATPAPANPTSPATPNPTTNRR